MPRPSRPKTTPPHRIERSELSAGRGFRLIATNVRGDVLGTMRVADIDGALTVEQIDIPPDARDLGLGTLLYTRAVETACEIGRSLHSSDFRSHFSEAFWRKQARKRRASCVGSGRASVYHTPIGELRASLLRACRERLPERAAQYCADAELSVHLANLPKPSGRHRNTWPCYRWATHTALCRQQPPDLSGLRARRP